MAALVAMKRPFLPAFVLASLLAAAPALADDVTISLDGTVDATTPPDHVLVPFQVPDGIVEIEVAHDDQSSDNILDWGLNGPDGFRGWGGGNTEDAIVGVHAASRSYLAGPIAAGTWNVVIGKAKLVAPPYDYKLTVTLRAAETQAPQTRKPYVPVAAISGPGWYEGDLHAHSRESGDASPTLEDFVTYAESVGLHFVEMSDHNTISQLDFFDDLQAAHPNILLVPGEEFTTYAGHANLIGATKWVDHKIGLNGLTIDASAQAANDEGAIFSVNHPNIDLGTLCIGCSWKHDLDLSRMGALEIWTSGAGLVPLFWAANAKLWNQWSAERHLPAIGGSDDHSGGTKISPTSGGIGEPTTMVYMQELSVAGLLEGIRNGRTMVKIAGPSGPMVDLKSDVPRDADTLRAAQTTMTATITAGSGLIARFVKNGVPDDAVDITTDPFVLTRAATAPPSGEDFYRVEVLSDPDTPTTVTSHLYVTLTGAAGAGAGGESAAAGSGGAATAPAATPAASDGGCSFSNVEGDAAALLGVGIFALGLALRSYRPRRRRSR